MKTIGMGMNHPQGLALALVLALSTLAGCPGPGGPEDAALRDAAGCCLPCSEQLPAVNCSPSLCVRQGDGRLCCR